LIKISKMYKQAISVILNHEGGYANNPNDPGGETNFGISKRSYPEIDIRNLTREKAIDIYHVDYWKPLKLYMIDNANICLEIFDFAVNSGMSRSVKTAQKLVGTNEDGIMGAITAGKINDYAKDFVKDYKHARIIYYENLANKKPELQIFLRGWINRVNHNYFINI